MQPQSLSVAMGRVGEADAAARRSPAEGEDAPAVLDRVRAELVALHASAIGLQRCLGPTLSAAAGDAAVLRAGQELDLLAQSLDALATFLGAMSRSPLGSGRLDAAAAAAHVTLDQLSTRLAGQVPPASQSRRGGEVELF